MGRSLVAEKSNEIKAHLDDDDARRDPGLAALTTVDKGQGRLETRRYWQIEAFHKLLKSVYKAEESKPRSSEKLANRIAIFCISGWKIFWLTMLHRAAPCLEPSSALEPRKRTC